MSDPLSRRHVPLPGDPGDGSTMDMADPAYYERGYAIAKVEPGEATLRLLWDDGTASDFHHLWLRDNCACRLCRHPDALERTFDLLSVPLDVRPEEAALTAGGALRLTWPGDPRHVSLFDPAWLRAHTYSGDAPPAAKRPLLLWGPELAGNLPRLPYAEVMETDDGLERWCHLLLDYGLALITGVPTEPGQVARVASRIGYVWSHYFGNVFDVAMRPKTESSAYTALSLPPHSDLPSRARPPAFQFLHCLANEVEGGEFILLDGFQIAELLRQSDPELYEILSTVPVEFRFVTNAVDYRFRSTILEHEDGQLQAVRFNSFLQSPMHLPYDATPRFYRAYHKLLTLASDPRRQIRLHFRPGDLMSFDNWRILHARTAFNPNTGRRHLQGCYLERDELDSRLRILARRSRRDGSR